MNHNAGDESPKMARKKFGGDAAEDFVNKSNINGICTEEINNSSILPQDLELLKQEILKEIRRDLTKMKQEILEGTWYFKKFIN